VNYSRRGFITTARDDGEPSITVVRVEFAIDC